MIAGLEFGVGKISLLCVILDGFQVIVVAEII